jgi:lipoate-protein ligase A
MGLAGWPEFAKSTQDAAHFAMPLFHAIDLFIDDTARNGPEQMALDEALLENARRPLLRPYRWAEQTASFGYSQSLSQVRRDFPTWPCVRRWTGGGIVAPQGDWTFALIVPADDPLAAVRAAEMYRLIHREVVRTLDQAGYRARLADPMDRRQGPVCFSAPALHDVVALDGRKLCGGAQRRTRRGILHQASIQNLPLPDEFAARIPAVMAIETRPASREAASVARGQERGASEDGPRAWHERA